MHGQQNIKILICSFSSYVLSILCNQESTSSNTLYYRPTFCVTKKVLVATRIIAQHFAAGATILRNII